MTEDKDSQNINFTDRNAVERFLDTEQFRPCANLECLPVQLEQVLYMPVCREGRFKREGVAGLLDMPLPPRPLSPLTYTTIGIWAPLVSCPPDCKGYRNRTVGRMQKALRRAAVWMFGKTGVKESRTIHEKEWWETWWGQSIILIITGVIAGLIIWMIIRRYDRPTPSAAVKQPTTQLESQPAQREVKQEEMTKPSPKPQQGARTERKATQPKVEINAPGGIPIVGNRGTINNPTVNNYAPPSRELLKEQCDTIQRELQEKQFTVMVGTMMDIPDGYDYALQLLNCFKAVVQVNPDRVLYMSTNGAVFSGIEIDFHGEAQPAGTVVHIPDNSPEEIVIKSLMNANLGHLSVNVLPDIPESQVRVIVGKQPKQP
jgi:hypothetical protein